MFKRIAIILLILVLLFSFSSCKSSEDEEYAEPGTSASDTQKPDNGNNTQTNDDGNEQSQNNHNNESSPSDNNTQNNEAPSDDDNNQQLPPLSDKGEYEVTFDFGYENKMQIEKTDGKVTELKISRTGYDFEGWFNGSDKWDFSKNVTSDTTLKAKWKLLTYKITYSAPGATLATTNPTTYTVEDGAIELTPPTKFGGVFAGWATDAGTGSTKNTTNGISKGTTGDLNFVAVWDTTSISLGKYEQDGNADNGAEPIIWIKLKEQNGKALYVSKYILDARPYQSPKSDVSWQTSGMRTWLNQTFYKTAFSKEEQGAILNEDIHTSVNSQTNVGTAVNTKDHVILLSLEESEELTSWAQRHVEVTKYAASQGCVVSDDGTGDWWLRSAGCYNNYAALVQENGGIRENGYSVDMPTIGIRPAIWVDSSKF